MNRRSFARSLAVFPFASTLVAETGTPMISGAGLKGARTFSYAGKELRPFAKEAEAVLMEQEGEGYLDHLWFGGDFPHYDQLRLRFYVDDERVPSIDCELGMAAGVGFADAAAPWGTQWGGITGTPSGIFLNYRVPFGKRLRITAQLPPGVPSDTVFWWIARGLLHYPLQISGMQLPATARLRLHRRDNFRTQPLEEFDLCRIAGAGMIFQVSMAAKSTNFEFLEGQMRAYFGKDPRRRCCLPDWRTTSSARTTSTAGCTTCRRPA